MSLRTYSLIAHPAFVDYIANCLDNRGPTTRADNTHYVEFPRLRSAQDISQYLVVSSELIWGMLKFPRRHYRRFEVLKKSGGFRVIHAPRTFLKVVQWWINDTILEKAKIHESAHGFVRGRSPVTNAKVHLGARHVLNVDIKDYFSSISFEKVQQAFEAFGYEGAVGADLAGLTTLARCLPQGAPTSPALSNLVFQDLDEQISHYASLYNMSYSRYADDLTYSSRNKISSSVPIEIDTMLRKAGLTLNSSKTRFMGPGQKLEITGLYLGQEGVNLSSKYLNSARGWFHSAAMRPEEYMTERSRIAGTVSMIRSVGRVQNDRVVQLGINALNAIDNLSQSAI